MVQRNREKSLKVNTDEFQAMALNSFDSSIEYYWYIAVQSTVTLLHINNDIKFNFDNHISTSQTLIPFENGYL